MGWGTHVTINSPALLVGPCACSSRRLTSLNLIFSCLRGGPLSGRRRLFRTAPTMSKSCSAFLSGLLVLCSGSSSRSAKAS